jgi:hypothetical protein
VILTYTLTEYQEEGFEEFPGSMFDYMLDSKQKGGLLLKGTSLPAVLFQSIV